MKRNTISSLMVATSVLWLSSCTEKTEFVSSQSQSNWKNADPSALASAELEDMPDIMPQTYYAAGRLFEKQGAAVRASVQYKKALLRDPKHVPSLSRLGMLYAKQGHHEVAEEYLQKAVELWPKSPQARNNLGFCYIMQERWYDAEAEFRNTIKLDPSFVRARVNLAMALAKLNRFDAALGEFKMAVPEPEAYYNLGLLYHSAQRYPEAADAFQTALQRNPKLTIAKRQLDRIKLQLERSRETPQPSDRSLQPTQVATAQPQRNSFASQSPVTTTHQTETMQPVAARASYQPTQQPAFSSQPHVSPVSPEPFAQTASFNQQPSSPVSMESASMEPVSVESASTEPASVESPSSQPSQPAFTQIQEPQVQEPQAPIQATNRVVVRTMEPVEYSTEPVITEQIDTELSNTGSQDAYTFVSDDHAPESNVQSHSPVISNPASLEESHAPIRMAEESQSSTSEFYGAANNASTQQQFNSDIPSMTPTFAASPSHQVQTNSTDAQPATQTASPMGESIATHQHETTVLPSNESNTQPTIAHDSSVLTLGVTPMEASSAPANPVDQNTSMVQNNASNQDNRSATPKQRSASWSTPMEASENDSVAIDISQIKSVAPADSEPVTAPKKAKTATHRSNMEDVEEGVVKPMGAVGAAPQKQMPQPIMQAMPIKGAARPASSKPPIQKDLKALEQAAAPVIRKMKPMESTEQIDDEQPATQDDDIEIVEMEATDD
ncbi:MAG: tetratricopeptide repeat protein [Planctomycetes bacterium]|nr:tetratricopeptide repeat protein [Planctomycetota bacterium]